MGIIVILVKWLVGIIVVLLKWLMRSIVILLKWLMWSIVIFLKWLMRIIIILAKWLMKQAEPEIETKQTQPKIETIDQGTEEASILGRITIDLLEKPVRFSSKEIAASTHNYSTKLGSGGFGDVYKGEFPGGVKLAVKVLKPNVLEKRVEEQFMAEVGTIGRTYHINLVRLFGFCFENDIKALVYEYMENGSLDDVLFLHNRINIKWEKLYDIAVGAAKGLEYLHPLGRQRIIHYDIKPGNILIDSKFCAKIADFGLAKLCNKDSDRAKTMAMVALWCIQYLPEARPSMSSVVKILENVVEVKKPPNPFQHLSTSNDELPQWIESSRISINSTSSAATFDGIGKSSTPIKKKYEIGFASLP